MKIEKAAYFTDGSSAVTVFEKPPGFHPDSPGAFRAGLFEAEKTGKTVERMTSFTVFEDKIIDHIVMTRAEILAAGR